MTDTFEKMDPTAKAQWLEALRSGKFTQGEGFLSLNGCNCCLGVLAEINGVPSEQHKGFDDGDDVANYKFADDYSSVYQPDNGYCGIQFSAINKLMNMNDGVVGEKKRTFPEIADWIEENL